MIFDFLLRKRGIKRGDTAAKSFFKTVSWRIIGTLDTIIIAYVLTGAFTIAASIGSVEIFTKTILYYFHERAWNKFI